MPAKIYKTADKKRVPSVTTILNNLGWGKEGLIHWAHQVGLDGVDLNEARSKAADVGTVTHEMIHADVTGQAAPDVSGFPQEMQDQCGRAFTAWVEWRELHKIEVIAAEQSLVSEEHRFGGTFDVVLDVGVRTLMDFKTGAGIYPDQLAQVAGYGILWNEHHPDNPIERYQLLRLGKEDGSFHWHSWPAEAIQNAKECFFLSLRIHNLAKVLKKQV